MYKITICLDPDHDNYKKGYLNEKRQIIDAFQSLVVHNPKIKYVVLYNEHFQFDPSYDKNLKRIPNRWDRGVPTKDHWHGYLEMLPEYNTPHFITFIRTYLNKSFTQRDKNTIPVKMNHINDYDHYITNQHYNIKQYTTDILNPPEPHILLKPILMVWPLRPPNKPAKRIKDKVVIDIVKKAMMPPHKSKILCQNLDKNI